MSEIADRYRKRAEGFNARVEAVPAAAWANPSPCDGADDQTRLLHFLGRQP